MATTDTLTLSAQAELNADAEQLLHAAFGARGLDRMDAGDRLAALELALQRLLRQHLWFEALLNQETGLSLGSVGALLASMGGSLVHKATPTDGVRDRMTQLARAQFDAEAAGAAQPPHADSIIPAIVR